MNKSALIKIAGILVVSFIIVTIVTFFLYPYLNEQKYEEIQTERSERYPSDVLEGGATEDGLPAFEGQENRPVSMAEAGSDSLFTTNRDSSLVAMIDSLMAVNDSLSQKLDSAQVVMTNLENALVATGADEEQLDEVRQGNDDVEFIAAAEEPKEAFSERVKSLLNLDEEDLTPIANQMTQEELVKIYTSSGNIQREKLLRSLSPERAAKLMQEIML
jgi:hypothetical protein